MKRQVACAVLCALLLAGLFGCAPVADAEIVLISGAGGVNDHSFNQSAWNGVRLFAGIHGKSYNYFEPSSQKEGAYRASAETAVEHGAKVLILPGQEFAVLAGDVGSLFPSASFVFLEAGDVAAMDENAVNITFASEEAGYLAGYAAVADGYTKLGFLGGVPVEGVVNYGYGFAQGAADAAKDYHKEVALNYAYSGTFSQSKKVEAYAAGWYQGGTELIFAVGGAMNESVFSAAEANGGKAIGTDLDQSALSAVVVTTAEKHLDSAVEQVLDLYYAGAFPGGQTLRYGMAQGAVGLEMDNARFRSFQKEEYDALRSRVSTGAVTVTRYTGSEDEPLSPPEPGGSGNRIQLAYFGEEELT